MPSLETRELILTAAERLFAELGVVAVSNRRIAEAAGQGNNTVVGYHFGTKADLVRAIVRRHADQVEDLRLQRIAAAGDDVRDWVTCLVRPSIDHLAALGTPTWYARFAAQVMTDPALRDIL
ncbi:TetR/AcrR family transcriptional regulator, partial [Kibdelosporangium lantanae]